MKEGENQFIRFVNCKGETISVPASATIEDLVKLGVRDIRLAKPEEPLEPPWYRQKD